MNRTLTALLTAIAIVVSACSDPIGEPAAPETDNIAPWSQGELIQKREVPRGANRILEGPAAGYGHAEDDTSAGNQLRIFNPADTTPGPVPPPFAARPGTVSQLLIDGESTSTTQGWPSAGEFTAAFSDITVTNDAANGDTIAQTVTQGPFDSGPLDRSGPSIAVLWSGINDSLAGTSPDAFYTAATGWASQRRAEGFDRLIIATIPAFTHTRGSGLDQNRLETNTLIRANSAGYDAVVDITAIEGLGDDDPTTDPQWRTDGIHFTPVANSQIAAAFIDAITTAAAASTAAPAPPAPPAPVPVPTRDGLEDAGTVDTYVVSTNLEPDSTYPYDSLVTEAVELLAAETTGQGTASFPHLADNPPRTCCTSIDIDSVAIRFPPVDNQPIRVLIAWTGTTHNGTQITEITESLWWWTPTAWQSDTARLLGFDGRAPFGGLPPGPGVLPPGAPVPVATGDVLWVAVDGNDSNPGTETAPLRQVTTALARAQPGTTILVTTGTWTHSTSPGTGAWNIPTGGVADNWIRLLAAPGHTPELVVTGGTGIRITAPYVEVSGFTIRGENFGPYPGGDYGYGILATGDAPYRNPPFDTHHIVITRNDISGFPVGGIGLAWGDHFVIASNAVHHNSYWGGEQGSGISMLENRDLAGGDDPSGYSNYLFGNISYANENRVNGFKINHANNKTDGNGIILDRVDVGGYTGRTLIANNVVFGNGGRGIHAWDSSHFDVVNNTLYANSQTHDLLGGPGELSALEATDVRWINNLVIPRPGGQATKTWNSTNVTTSHNVFVAPSATVSGPTDIFTNTPGVVALGSDFHLAPGSVAIDAGDDAWASVTGVDHDGLLRPPTGTDVGAYETSGTPRTNPTTPAAASTDADQLVVMADIGECGSPRTGPQADLVASLPGPVIVVGDIGYPNGTATEFTDCFATPFAQITNRVLPVAGNHEYSTHPDAAAWKQHFNRTSTRYATDIGNHWRLIVVDTECNMTDGCGPNDPQQTWLTQQLATSRCTIVAAHRPWRTSYTAYDREWRAEHIHQIAIDSGADIIVSGHAHIYEHFDWGNTQQFIVGSAGAGTRTIGTQPPGSTTRFAAYGALTLNLEPDSYSWRFLDQTQTERHTGSRPCA